MVASGDGIRVIFFFLLHNLPYFSCFCDVLVLLYNVKKLFKNINTGTLISKKKKKGMPVHCSQNLHAAES